MSMVLITFFVTFLMATNDKKGLLIMTVKVIFLALITCFVIITLYLLHRSATASNRLSKSEIAYCVFCGIFYFIWAISKPFNYGPDEYMRYDISLFLFQNNRLPIGAEAINSIWGFSYAHFPTVLGNILSYIPMKVAGSFTNNSSIILIAARLVSVFSGVLTVYFVIKTSKVMFATSVKWIMVIFVSTLPQFAFLSSYVNNDIVALMGASITLYSWCYAYKNKFDLKNSIALALGIAICALSYFNSYGWIFLSMVFFSGCYIINKLERKKLVKYGLVISSIVIVCISYFFVRHYILYGDFLGFETVNKFGEMYAIQDFKPSVKLSFKEQGGTIVDMLFRQTWINSTCKSFIECFGYMNVWGHSYIYSIHGFLLLFVLYVLTIYIILEYRNVTMASIKARSKTIAFYSIILCSMIIPVLLSVSNSYTSDYQAQGRYVIGALLGYSIFITKSADIVISKINKIIVQDVIVYFICISLQIVVLIEFFSIYLPS